MLVDYDGSDSDAEGRSVASGLPPALGQAQPTIVKLSPRKLSLPEETFVCKKHVFEDAAAQVLPRKRRDVRLAAAKKHRPAVPSMPVLFCDLPTAAVSPAHESSNTYEPFFKEEVLQVEDGPSALDAAANLDIRPPRDDDLKLLLNKREVAQGKSIDIYDHDASRAYQENQRAIESGHGVAENEVRSIGGGKHQLSSLLNSALSQKDALEAQFAKYKDNKKLSGAQYGF